MQKIIFFLWNIFFSFIAYGQSDFTRAIENWNTPFYMIQARGDTFFKYNPDTSEGGGGMTYGRWSHWWETRVSGEDGTFKRAFDAVFSLLQTPICTTSSVPSNWSELGPGFNSVTQTFTTPLAQRNGIIISAAVDPINPSIIYCGSNTSGAWKTTDDGQSWFPITENLRLPGMGIQDIAIDPTNTQVVYLATGLGNFGSYGVGVLKSFDGGVTWNSTGLTYNPSAATQGPFIVRKLLIDPNNTNIIYALVNDEVHKTTDGGSSWVKIFDLKIALPPSCGDPFSCRQFPRDLVDIEMRMTGINPITGQITYDSNTLYISSNNTAVSVLCCTNNPCSGPIGPVGTNGGAVLLKTTNGGSTWTELTGVTNNQTSALAQSNPTIVYSTHIAIALSPHKPNSIFLHYSTVQYISGTCTPFAMSSNNINYTQESPDGGVTWNTAYPETTTGGFYYRNEFIINPADIDADEMYVGSAVTSKHTKGGNTTLFPWSAVHGYNSIPVHADIRIMKTFFQGGNAFVIVGTDGGVSTAQLPAINDNSWTNITPMLPITQFYGFDGSDIASDLIVGGAQDNGAYTFNSGVWSNIIIGDAYECAIDEFVPSFVYAEGNSSPTAATAIRQSTNSGISWGQTLFPKSSSPPCPPPFSVTDAGPFTRPITSHSVNGQLYAGYHDIWKLPNPRQTPTICASDWVKLSNFSVAPFNVPSDVALQAIEMSPTDPNIIYALYSDPCWGCPSPPHAYLLKTTVGGGTTSNAWADLTNNIFLNAPSISDNQLIKWIPLTDIAIDPYNSDRIWITCGAFYGSQRVIHSGDGGQTWIDYSNGLTDFPVHTIVYEKGSNDGLYIGTDVGIFYRNASMTQWECFSGGLPVVPITDLEINYALNEIRAATFGRGIWKSNLACPSNANLTIFGNLSGFAEAETTLTITTNGGNTTNIGYGDFTARAGYEIIVKPANIGEEIILGPNSHLFIHGCNHPGNSFRQAPSGSPKGGELTPVFVSSAKDDEKEIYETENVKYTYYPNPFTEHLHIDFLLEKNSPVQVSVYNSMGQLIEILAKGNHQAGEHTVLFNNPSVKSGLYFVRMQFGDMHYTKAVLKTKE